MGRKPSETLRFFTTTLIGVIFGFLVGVSISIFYVSKINPANYIPETLLPTVNQTLTNSSKTWISSDPRGAERLPPGIVASESNYFLRRLWGEPSQVCIMIKALAFLNLDH
ncbi:uncharacterized protein LOC141621583 [Silene latifolia]|uniref:uncharacterized protein LOC141621583 n=1 Tax=Silene latifolia TaxID=37657 RepID=UPI003D77F9C4